MFCKEIFNRNINKCYLRYLLQNKKGKKKSFSPQCEPIGDCCLSAEFTTENCNLETLYLTKLFIKHHSNANSFCLSAHGSLPPILLLSQSSLIIVATHYHHLACHLVQLNKLVAMTQRSAENSVRSFHCLNVISH